MTDQQYNELALHSTPVSQSEKFAAHLGAFLSGNSIKRTGRGTCFVRFVDFRAYRNAAHRSASAPHGSLSIFSSFNRKSCCPIASLCFSPMVQHGFFQLTDRRSCPASRLFLPPDTGAHPSYPESRRTPPATVRAHAAPTSRARGRRRGRQSCARRGIRRAVR